jgi:hypothetical protein
MIFCRDYLRNLSFRNIGLALSNISRSSRLPSTRKTFFLFPRAKSGAAFNRPSSIHLAKDFSARQMNDQDEYLGVWRIKDIRRWRRRCRPIVMPEMKR